MTELNKLAAEIHETSSAHGFWPEEGRNFGEMMALAASELSEALEEHRAGKDNFYHVISTTDDPGKHSPEVMGILARMMEGKSTTLEDIRTLTRAGLAKPEGTAVELVDCIIRCLDTLHSLNVDIDYIMREKMLYNDSRPHKHGKEY